MRALTVWQPWAQLIALGIKTIETRSWGTPYRGPLLIHAGQSEEGLIGDCPPPMLRAIWEAGYSLSATPPAGRIALPRGCVVAVAELVEVAPTQEWRERGLADVYGDFSRGRMGWRVERVRMLAEPIRCAGRQGLWSPHPSIVAQIRGAS